MLAADGWMGVGHWVVHEQPHAQAGSEVCIPKWFDIRVEKGRCLRPTAHGQQEALLGAKGGSEGLAGRELHQISMIFLSLDRLMSRSISFPTSGVQRSLGFRMKGLLGLVHHG